MGLALIPRFCWTTCSEALFFSNPFPFGKAFLERIGQETLAPNVRAAPGRAEFFRVYSLELPGSLLY
jgi:hypothetical protein